MLWVTALAVVASVIDRHIVRDVSVVMQNPCHTVGEPYAFAVPGLAVAMRPA